MMTTPKIEHTQAWLNQSNPEVRIYYTVSSPQTEPIGTILLIHGFPSTSHQYRDVLPLLAQAGYKAIAPDYRGAGHSSKPPLGYSKSTLAWDLHMLLKEHLHIKEKVHIVGHDIGGMIAHAYVSQFPESVASITWGECPLPGTTFYHNSKHTPPFWHFDFHTQTDIAVSLVTGREKLYLKHFYDRLATNQSAFSEPILEYYTSQYSQPGALRAAFTTYATFEEDAAQNLKWRDEGGKVKVRSRALFGEKVFMTAYAEEMADEFYQNPSMAVVEGCGHFIAEENPEGFVKAVLGFIEEKQYTNASFR